MLGREGLGLPLSTGAARAGYIFASLESAGLVWVKGHYNTQWGVIIIHGTWDEFDSNHQSGCPVVPDLPSLASGGISCLERIDPLG